MLTILSVATALTAATGMVWLALSLRCDSPRSLFLGAAIPLVGMVSWSYGATPVVVWAVMGAVGVITMVWTFPWWRDGLRLPRLGSFWLAVPVWFVGALSALLAGGFTVTAQRIAFGGFALLIVLLAFAAARTADISIGVAAGFLLCLALVTLSGATELFASERWTVEGEWGHLMSGRFWGGPLLGYHPNFIGLTAVMVAMRVGPDPRFHRFQRIGSLAVAAFLLLFVESRTSFIVAFVAAGVFALGHLARGGLSRWRVWRWFATAATRRVAALALAPLLATTLVFVASGGFDLLFKNRYATTETEASVNGVLSGRVDIWGDMLTDYAEGSAVEWALGNPDNARGVLMSITDPEDPEYRTQARHTADNAPIGVLYRSGVVGLAAFGVGLVLVSRRVFAAGAPPWAPVAVTALFVGAVTEDEIASTAPAWLLVCAAELAAWRRAEAEPNPARTGVNVPVATSPTE